MGLKTLYLDAMPHFISKVANADMFCLVGLGLEVGWAQKYFRDLETKKFNQVEKVTVKQERRSRHLMFPQVELIDLRETSILKATPLSSWAMLFTKEAKRF